MLSPMTFIVVLVLVIILVSGIVLLRRAVADRSAQPCPSCGLKNASGARFCANCGASLS